MAKGVKPTIRTDRNAVTRSPSAPEFLSPEGKREWRRIMPQLVERKILTTADLGMVEAYCCSIARIREAEALIQKDGLSAPLFRMQDKAAVTARQLASELGLTPVSRSRPSIRDDEQDEGADDLGL